MRNVKAQVDDRLEASDHGELHSRGESVKDRLSGVEGEIYQVQNRSNQDPLNFPIKLNNKLAALLGTVESAEAAPTRQAYEVFDHLSRLLDTELEQMTLIFQQDLAQLNELLRSLGMDPIDTENLIT